MFRLRPRSRPALMNEDPSKIYFYLAPKKLLNFLWPKRLVPDINSPLLNLS